MLSRDERDARRGRVLACCLIALSLVAAVCLSRAAWSAWSALRPALPEGWSGNPWIAVEAPFPLDLEIGTPLFATEPELQRWGEVYGPSRAGGVRVGMKPGAFERLREDARLVVLERTLGELEILSQFFRGERWRAVLARLEAWCAEQRVELDALRADVRRELSSRFRTEDVERLLEHPALRAATMEALSSEVLQGVDWRAALRDAAESEAGRELGRFLGEKAELDRAIAPASRAFLSLVLGEIASVPAALWGDPLGTVLDFRARARSGLERAARGTAEQLVARSLERLGAAYAADPAAVHERVLAAGETFASEAELDAHLRDAWRAFVADPRVGERLRALGDEGWQKLKEALRALAADPRVRARIEGLARSLGVLSAELLREIALDPTGTTWNPLLLALLRERLLGRPTPMIVVVDPGRGGHVASGTSFGASVDAGELW